MTPLWLALLLPLGELAVAFRMWRRIAWFRYPALMAYLVTEAGWHFAAAYHYQIGTRWGQPFRMGVRAWVAIELFRFACVELRKWDRARLVGEALTISGTGAWLVAMWTTLSPLENFFVFRGYWHLVLALALWWLVLRMKLGWALVAENQDHRAYRWGMTRWFTILALSGMFVKGSAGYWVFPFTDTVWWWANVTSYGLLIVNVLWMGWKMTSHFSSLRPEIAYGSLVAAFACRK